MSFKTYSPFRRSRRVLARLPLSTLLCAAAFGGAVLLLVFQSLFSNPCSEIHHPERALIQSRPEPIVVVAAGLPRTGSTWVYNVLRILLRMRDPNSVSGWYADLIAIWKNHKTGRYDHMSESWLSVYKSLNTSLLLKMHGPGPFKSFSKGSRLEAGSDLTVITHRDLRTEVRSWVYQNWNGSIHAGDITNTPFGNPADWVRVAHHILRERKATLNSIGRGNFLDIRYEDWNGKSVNTQVAVVEKLARELRWNYTKGELLAAVVEAARLEPPANDAKLMYNPVNKLHPGHVRVDSSNSAFQAALQRGYRAIETDAETSAFLRLKKYL